MPAMFCYIMLSRARNQWKSWFAVPVGQKAGGTQTYKTGDTSPLPMILNT